MADIGKDGSDKVAVEVEKQSWLIIDIQSFSVAVAIIGVLIAAAAWRFPVNPTPSTVVTTSTDKSPIPPNPSIPQPPIDHPDAPPPSPPPIAPPVGLDPMPATPHQDLTESDTKGRRPSFPHEPAAIDDNMPARKNVSAPQKFTIETPVAVVAPEGEVNYRDKFAAASLRGMLWRKVNMTQNQTAARLLIEVTSVSADKNTSGHPCPNPTMAGYSGVIDTAQVTIRMVWSNGSVEFPPKPFSDTELTCDHADDDLAHYEALNHVLTSIKDTIVDLSHKP